MAISVVVASDDVEVGKTTVARVIALALREAGFTNVELDTSDLRGEEIDEETLAMAVEDLAHVDITVVDQDATLAEAGL